MRKRVELLPKPGLAHTRLGPCPVHLFSEIARDRLGQREERGLHILKNGRKQAVILVPPKFGRRDAVDADLAGGRAVQSAQELDERRLARAVHTDQRHSLTGAEREGDIVQRILLRAVIAEGDVLEHDLRRMTQRVRRKCPAAAVLVRKIHEFAEVADLEACRLHGVPRGEDAADIGGKAGDGGKIEHELVGGDLAAQRHGDQHRVGRAVADEDHAEIGQPGQQLPRAQARLPQYALRGKIVIDRAQPSGHAVDADILRARKIGRAFAHIIGLLLDVRAFGPRAVFVAVICPGAEPVRRRSGGQKQQEPRADSGNDRAEEQVAEQILQQLHGLLRHFQQRHLAEGHPCRRLRAAVQITH